MTKQAPGTRGDAPPWAREGTARGEATCSLRSGSVTPLGGRTCSPSYRPLQRSAARAGAKTGNNYLSELHCVSLARLTSK